MYYIRLLQLMQRILYMRIKKGKTARERNNININMGGYTGREKYFFIIIYINL